MRKRLGTVPPKQTALAKRRAMLAVDKDPDVPPLQRMLHQLQKAVAGEELTPAMANQTLGIYADSLHAKAGRSGTRRKY